MQFWGAVSPFIVEYNFIKANALYYEHVSEEELDRQINTFHKKTAARAVEIILDLGGIYVKIGQFASTMGAGILDDAYVTALQPLQDGVPVRLVALSPA